MKRNTKLIDSEIQVLDEEREEWIRLSLANLERAYGEDEPEYSLNDIDSLRNTMDEISCNAQEKGLTPEILESLLADE